MNSKKWAFIGYLVSGVGMIAGLIGQMIANKQLELEVEEQLETKLNPKDEEES